MNAQREFDNLVFLLEQNASKLYVTEILQEIEGSEVLFHSGTEIETAHALRIYSDRFAIQKGVTQHDKIEGYEKLLENLSKERDNRLHIFKLTGITATYIVFVSTGMNRLIGVLKSEDKGIEKGKGLNQLYKEKKLTSSSKRFYRKVLQSD